MGFRFWRRVGLLPGVTLNLSKSGASVSVGPRGAKFTVGPSGKRVTLGIPGTGLFYTTKLNEKGSTPDTGQPNPGKRSTRKSPKETPSAGFSDRIASPKGEISLLEGLRDLKAGNEDAAYANFRKSAGIADGAFFAGVIALKKRNLQESIDFLKFASEREKELGSQVAKHGLSATIALQVTDEVATTIGPDLRGALIALVEAYQGANRKPEAIECLRRLRKMEPTDVVIKVSLAELLMENGLATDRRCKEVLGLADGVGNLSPIHTALLLYKAKALRGLGKGKEALGVLTSALDEKEGRSEELLRALRYEYSKIYEEIEGDGDAALTNAEQGTSIERSISPEEVELRRKQAELERIKSQVADRELEFETLKNRLSYFEARYLRTVGVLYAELDEIEAKIAEALAEQSPGSKDAQEHANDARGKAEESRRASDEAKEKPPKDKFVPSEDLKKMRRDAALKMHPDYAKDEKDRKVRNDFMSQVNKAYEEGDHEKLEHLMREWESRPESVQGDGVGADLVRVIRMISTAKKRLSELEKEIVALKESEYFVFMVKVEEAEEGGRDLLQAMEEDVSQRIGEARKRWNKLQNKYGAI